MTATQLSSLSLGLCLQVFPSLPKLNESTANLKMLVSSQEWNEHNSLNAISNKENDYKTKVRHQS